MLEMISSIQTFCMMMLSFLGFSLIENEVTRAHLRMFSGFCFDFTFCGRIIFDFRVFH